MLFSVIIPTFNRERELINCLQSIASSTVIPDEVIIVDDAQRPAELLEIKSVLGRINLIYLHKRPMDLARGTSLSRNLGRSSARNDIFFILDDDLVLDKFFFEEIMNQWEKNQDQNLVGIGGIISNNRRKTNFERIYNRLFGLDSTLSWDVNPNGFQVWDDSIEGVVKGNYVHGGVCAYSKTSLGDLNFQSLSGNRDALEDVDFCLRAKISAKYFLVNPSAKVVHLQSQSGRATAFESGIIESRNRKLIYRNLLKSKTPVLNFTWASLGWNLRQFLAGHFSKGLGFLWGLIIP